MVNLGFREMVVVGVVLLWAGSVWGSTANYGGGDGDWNITVGPLLPPDPGPSYEVYLRQSNVGYVVTLSSDVTIDYLRIKSGGTLRHFDGTLTINGRLDLWGGVYDARGGILANARVRQKPALGNIEWDSGVLQNVTLESDLDVVEGGRLDVMGSLTLSGTRVNLMSTEFSFGSPDLPDIYLGDSPAQLSFNSTGELKGKGEVVFDGTSDGTVYTEEELTIGPKVTVRTGDEGGSINGGILLDGNTGIREYQGELINQGKVSAQTAGKTLKVVEKTLTNQGVMEAINGGILSVDVETLDNQGKIIADSDSQIHDFMARNFSNSGKIEIAEGNSVDLGIFESVLLYTEFWINGEHITDLYVGNNPEIIMLDDNGTLLIELNYPDGTQQQFTRPSDGNVTIEGIPVDGEILQDGSNGGRMSLMGGTMKVRADEFTNLAGGLIEGIGTLDVSEAGFINEGTISPGLSAGLLNVVGDLLQSEDGVLEIELGNTANDLIMVDGVAQLGGKIAFKLLEGDMPEPGSSFTVLTADEIIDDGWTTNRRYYELSIVDLGGIGQGLEVTFVPEPGSAAMFAMVLMIGARRCGTAVRRAS